MLSNLSTQGYCMDDAERRRLWLGLRFPTGLCLGLVVTGLVLQSAVLLAALVPVGAVAGWTSRHPFDYLWNRFATPALPPNPTRRRHSFKLATVWLALCSVLFALGASTAGLVLGGVLVAVCGLVTATNLCIPSLMLGLWDRRTASRALV